jgi:hypothetical protein
LLRYVYPTFLVLVWIGIVSLLLREGRRCRRVEGSPPTDRHGLAVLLEMARSWPRTGSRPIEPIFVASGGQHLDHAGSREVVRMLRSDWSGKPSLLVLLFAPGAGDKLRLFAAGSPASDLDELVRGAARGLWIPIQHEELLAPIPPWPFGEYRPAVALVGSDPSARLADSVDPQALHRAAQLATEIALRWGKQQKAAGAPESTD